MFKLIKAFLKENAESEKTLKEAAEKIKAETALEISRLKAPAQEPIFIKKEKILKVYPRKKKIKAKAA